jgi:LPXTG-motif cell wall-anchored protein
LALGAVLAVGTAVPASAASLPSSDRIYAYDCTDGANDLQLLEIQADGTATAIGTGTGTPGTLCPGQPAWDPGTQKAYFVLDNKLWSTDTSTGVSTEVASTSGAGVAPLLLSSPSLAIAPDGTAWVQYDGWVGTIDLATAVVSQFPDTALNYPRTNGLYYITAFAYNATDSKLYAIDAEDKVPDFPNELATMSQTTGEITVNGPDVDIPGYQNSDIENMVAMAFDSSGQGWLIYSNMNLRSFDTATATIFDQGNLLLGGATVSTNSIFIAPPPTGGGGGVGGGSPVDDGYLDYLRGRVEGENSTDLPDTGGSWNTLNVIVGLGCLAIGSTLVAASRRRWYS